MRDGGGLEVLAQRSVGGREKERKKGGQERGVRSACVEMNERREQ